MVMISILKPTMTTMTVLILNRLGRMFQTCMARSDGREKVDNFDDEENNNNDDNAG